MNLKSVNSSGSPAPSGGYTQALEVSSSKKVLYISGQIPVSLDGTVPKRFDEQARLVWRNIENQLTAAGMTLDNLVKHTTFLADRQYREENSRVRQEVLGERETALTVVIAGIYDESWLLEIEAIAMS